MNPSDMMNHTGAWMDGGLMIWIVLDIVIGVLLVYAFSKWSMK